MRQGHITCLTGGDGKAEAHKVCARSLQAIGFGIKTQCAGFARARDPMVQPGNLRDTFIAGGINYRHGRRGGGRPCYCRAFRAITCVHGLRVARNRLIGSGGIGNMPNTLQQRIKSVMLQKRGQRLFGDSAQSHVLHSNRQGAVVF